MKKLTDILTKWGILQKQKIKNGTRVFRTLRTKYAGGIVDESYKTTMFEVIGFSKLTGLYKLQTRYGLFGLEEGDIKYLPESQFKTEMPFMF